MSQSSTTSAVPTTTTATATDELEKQPDDTAPGMAGDKAAPTNAAASSTSAQSSPSKIELSEAMQHLAWGKRHLLVQDIPAAVAKLAEACQTLGRIYGETGVECAEAFFYYGKALLELARLESGVIDGGGLEDEDEEEDDEDDEDEDEDGEEEAANNNGDPDPNSGESDQADEGKETEGQSEQNVGGDKEKQETEKDENESIGSNDAGTSDAKDSKDKSEIENEDVEDPSNLQLSWEMLELAKTLFKKHADSLPAEDTTRLQLESKLSEAYQVLGEVSIENEDYAQAIEDLRCCLRRRQELLPEDSRCIAETHYQMGVALGFNLEFDAAVEALEDAIMVLQKRIDLLKVGKESQDESVKRDAFYTREREIEEIEKLLPEIREKIVDTRDMQEETFKKLGDKALMEETEMAAIATSGKGAVPNGKAPRGVKSGEKETKDISHMIKKRKKSSSDESGADGSAAKRPNVANGN